MLDINTPTTGATPATPEQPLEIPQATPLKAHPPRKPIGTILPAAASSEGAPRRSSRERHLRKFYDPETGKCTAQNPETTS